MVASTNSPLSRSAAWVGRYRPYVALVVAEALAPVLLDIHRETGAALLVIEHDMPLLTGISDRLLALDLGSVVCEGPPEAVLADPAVISSYLGGSTAAIRRSDATVA